MLQTLLVLPLPLTLSFFFSPPHPTLLSTLSPCSVSKRLALLTACVGARLADILVAYEQLCSAGQPSSRAPVPQALLHQFLLPAPQTVSASHCGSIWGPHPSQEWFLNPATALPPPMCLFLNCSSLHHSEGTPGTDGPLVCCRDKMELPWDPLEPFGVPWDTVEESQSPRSTV